MLTYNEALAKLKGKSQRPLNGQRGTQLVQLTTGGIAVRCHETNVVTIHENGNYTLHTGGWSTVTTKSRINEYSPARIYQKKGVWYHGDGTRFFDFDLIDGNGRILDHGPEYTDSVDKIEAQYEK